MFTGRKISLSEVIDGHPGLGVALDILRDFSFAYVGKIPSLLESRLVAVSALSHVADLDNVEGVAGVVTTPELAGHIPAQLGLAVCPEPYVRATDIHEYVADLLNFQWVDFDSDIDPTARVHPTAVIAAQNVRIGPDSVIGPNVVIYPRVVVGRGCSIGPGSVLGFDAFDLKPGSDPQRFLRQSGGVLVGDFVCLKANVTIDRASFGGFTTLKRAVSIDNLSYIAHDCLLQEDVRVASAVSVNGRTVIGSGTYVGPNAVISNGLNIGSQCRIALGAVVTQSIGDNSRVAGNFAVDHEKLINFVKSIR